MIQRRRHGRMRGSKPKHSTHHKLYKGICAGCGKEIIIQVPPPNDKKLLCIDCFKK